MKAVNSYIDDVMRDVFATPEDRERLEADLRSHFAEGEAEGRTPREIIEGLGTPAEVAAAFNADREFLYAGFWLRLVAFIGDFGLLVALTVPFFGMALVTGIGFDETTEPPITWFIICGFVFLALIGICIFYFPLLESHYGKTLGKHLMRIRVVRENGAPIGLGQAFVRRLSFYFEMLVIDALFIPFTEKRQRALDIIAKTVVAREPGESAPVWGYATCLLLPVASILCLLSLVLLCAPG